MCRSIKTLRDAEEPVTGEDIEAAALQFVRKISGYRKPSRAEPGGFRFRGGRDRRRNSEIARQPRCQSSFIEQVRRRS